MNDKLKNNAELFCIIPAAGKSTRYKKSNKIFECIEEELDILNASVLNINNLGVVKKTFVGYDDSSKEASDFKDIIQSDLDQNTSLEVKITKKLFKKIELVKGGRTRQDTVFNCMQHIKDNFDNTDDTWVIVHDAARPCIFPYENLEFINKTIECDTSSIMAIPISDTIKKIDGNSTIDKTVPRENLWLAQTPQMFKFNILYDSLKHCDDNNIAVTDDSQALEVLGHKCRIHIGKPYNYKITYESDMAYMKCIYEYMSKYYEKG